MAFRVRNVLLGSTALTIASMAAGQAYAQTSIDTDGGLAEIVVTAQKREQSLQDVPIAVTAITEDSLEANRIFTVNDLSSFAPGLTVAPSAGGISTPAFTIRGQQSFGVVAGSDKQVSIYIDGVYVSSPRGSIFQLPDIQRLEVLRGPQGTLFGRNATAGAVSVTTRDPSGDVGFKVKGTYGNLNATRIQATLDTPQFGPFSAYVSFIHDYRRGDIENASAGLAWDRTLSPSGFARRNKSPRWLGTIKNNSYFAAVKFEPSDSFKMVYKYDRNDDKGTPEGTAFIGYDASLGGGLAGGVLTALYASNGSFDYMVPDAQRPDIVQNGWVTPRYQRVSGHSLTATWQATDSITVKNIAAYRKAIVFATSSIDGVSTLNYTQPVADAQTFLTAVSVLGAGFFALPPDQQAATLAQFAPIFDANVGKRINVIASGASSIAEQWSDEIQVNYTSEKLNITAGALWFHSKDEAGGPIGMENTTAFDFTPNCSCLFDPSGVVPLANEGRYFNKATSLAAYAQFEYRFTDTLEFVAGARITHDKKTSKFRWDVDGDPRPLIVPPKYTKTKPNFLVGVNWTPNSDTLVYGKWSNSFVSGGSTAGIEFQPETASSFEAGLKADFLDKRLRTNIALYHVTYKHFQQPGSTTSPTSTATILPILTGLYGAGIAEELVGSISTFVTDSGTLKVKGFEAEVTAAPAKGLTLGGSVGYADSKFTFVPDNVLSAWLGVFLTRARPDWTGAVYGTYETEPLVGDATLNFRVDATYTSSILQTSNPVVDVYPDGSNEAAVRIPSKWLLNGRIALRHIAIGGADAELALWGKNLTDNKDPNFILFTPLATSANFGPSRTYGVDLTIQF
ncbi:MAG: TonB-dependent receptor [Novosphingobium sp.]|nr:TonB-dependent receptor [Novosphingobium sp.]MCP5402693.1 TonB-dependent receptor [Novosphingobium sp.]